MQGKEILHKIISFIDRRELNYLDGIIYDVYFSTGKKVPRSYAVRKILQLSKKLRNFHKEIVEELKEEKGESAKEGGEENE